MRKIIMMIVCGGFLCNRVLGATGPSDGWPFLITPGGEPFISTLASSSDKEWSGVNMTIRHFLKFDGRGYYSSMEIPILTSFLIFSDKDEFQWRRPDGTRMLIPVSQLDSYSGDGQWHVVGLGDGRYKIYGGSDQYEYEHCLLKRWCSHSTVYRYDYIGSLVSSITISHGSTTKTLRIYYDGMRVMTAVMDGKRGLSFSYNCDRQMISCDDVGGNDEHRRFGYKDHLLNYCSVNGIVEQFCWGGRKYNSYYKLPILPPPFVVNDGRFEYDARYTRFGMLVCFRSMDGGIKGNWSTNLSGTMIEGEITHE